MKRLLAGTTVIVAAALSPGLAHAAACASGPLSGYLVSGFSCTLGSTTFSGFSYSPDGNPGTPQASQVSVVPRLTSSSAGFQFANDWSAPAAGAVASSTLAYMATTGAGTSITGDTASLSAQADGQIDGDGSFASVTDTFDNGQSLAVGTNKPGGTESGEGVTAAAFGATPELRVSQNIQAVAGQGTAFLANFTNAVDLSSDPVPTSASVTPPPASVTAPPVSASPTASVSPTASISPTASVSPTPSSVPEPMSAALLASSIGWLGLVRRLRA